jgi:hypothetical protein
VAPVLEQSWSADGGKTWEVAAVRGELSEDWREVERSFVKVNQID